MKKLAIVTALLTASAGFAQAPASAPAANPAPAQSGGAASEDPNERICRNIETTATRLGRARECKTRAEWAALARQARNNAERAQARSAQN